jgi:hypothetical protein
LEALALLGLEVEAEVEAPAELEEEPEAEPVLSLRTGFKPPGGGRQPPEPSHPQGADAPRSEGLETAS